MSKRRMINSDVTETDKFYELSIQAQALYYHLHSYADDDGFVSKLKLPLNMLECGYETVKELEDNGYIISFNKAPIVITHWLVSNDIKKDRYTPTLNIREKKYLKLENNIYFKCDTVQDVNPAYPLNRQYWADDMNPKKTSTSKSKRQTEKNMFNKMEMKSDVDIEKIEESLVANGGAWTTVK